MLDFIGGAPVGGDGVKIAVLDTGVLSTHSDLVNRIVECKDFSSPRAAIVDGKCSDGNGHGTHVAGIIGADRGEDGLGILGMAPESELAIYKVCNNKGSCWADDIASAILEASDAGANIINLSLGSDASIPLIKETVNYALRSGSLVVASAGNDGPDDATLDYPASYGGVVAVGAINRDLDVVSWSSRGDNLNSELDVVEDGDIEFAVPGSLIESTWSDGGYHILSGTSMAAPHISGLAARIWQSDADDPAQATRELLKLFSYDLWPFGEDNDSGFGVPTLR